MPHDVFLSYASADRAAADAVCAALEARGIRCWIAPRDVRAGEDWGEAILTAIGRAHAMVLVLSRHTAGSVHVRNEVVTAVSQSLALVPVRIEDCQPGGALRLHLAGSHWLNVFPPPIESHADALATGVRLALAADATIEIPRAQAAALVAAARAGAARGGGVAPEARGTMSPEARGTIAPEARGTMPPEARGTMPPEARGTMSPEARGTMSPEARGAAADGLGSAPPGARPAAPPPGRAAHPGSAAARPAPAGPAPAPPRPGTAVPAPHLPTARRGAGLVLAVLGLLLLAALGAAGWHFVPQLRAVFGAAPAGLSVAQAPPRAPDVTAPAPPVVAAPPAAPAPAAPRAAESAPPPPPAEPSAPRSMAQGPPPRPAPVRVVNVASETISRLFVARADQGIGQEDWLGQAQITPGNAVLLRPPPGQGCLFNIRVVYVGGRAEDRPGVDLCAAPELRFEGNKAAAGAPAR